MGGSNGIANQTGNPLWDLPITDPRCMNASCEAFVIGWNESQERYPNSLFLNFGIWTVAFWTTLVGIFTLLHFKHRIEDMNRKSMVKEKFQGFWRLFTYRRLHGWLGEHLDLSYGILVLLAVATIFLTVLPFYQGFFLREQFRYGSPPLSVRCAMLISALTPIMMLLAGKMNLLTILTGVSYAKLNVWHRFCGYAVFVLAIIHTVPHLIAPIREGGLAELTYLYQIHRREFSGTFLLTNFVCLVVFSLPYFRGKFYELFKHGHILMALCWFALIFWHIRNEYVAPEFFFAAVGVWVCSVIARMVYRNRFMFPITNITRGFPTTLEYLPGSMTRVAVTVPPKMRWMPGQHCYISVPGISSLGNHPFTIASIPHPRYEGEGDSHEMVFLIRECGGFTKMLGAHAKSVSALNLAESVPGTPTSPAPALQVERHRGSSEAIDQFPSPPGSRDPSPPRAIANDEISRPPSSQTLRVPDTPRGHTRQKSLAPSYFSMDKAESQVALARVNTWVDGPFGDYQRPLHRHYEGFITIAGGSGLTASLPWIMYLTNKMRRAAESYEEDSYECKMRNVTFIWSIRKAEWICWARREIIHALRAAAASDGCFRAVIYVTSRDTDEKEAKSMQLDLMVAAGLSEGIDRATVELRFGRPKMEAVLPEYLDRKKTMVRVCGPNALKSGVANAVAGMQRLVIQGQVQAISLDSETFGW